MVDFIRLSIKTLFARITKVTGLLAVSTVVFGISSAHALNVTVIDQDGVSITGGMRWLVEEDTTFPVDPGVQTQNSVSLDFHRSYAPVLGNGTCSNPCVIDLTTINGTAGKHLFVSVLPNAGYNLGGIGVAPGATDATVRVTRSPMPTARIRVQVFEDYAPVNGAPDTGTEDPLTNGRPFDPTQFSIVLEEGGGRYGATGGQVLYDIYGNLLGTVYAKDAAGNVILGPDGTPATIVSVGTGVMHPGPDGFYTIENIAAAKYGIVVIPPAGQGYVQTSTIEGSPVIDAWVKPNEPELYVELGNPGPHVFIGFAHDTNTLPGGSTISGTVVSNHLSRPPVVGFNVGAPVDNCWVALHPGVAAATEPASYVGPCTEGAFSISGVPDGTYQLAIWNTNLSTIFDTRTVNVAGGNVNLGDILVFEWFAHMLNYVYLDANENGFPDAGENAMTEQNVNVRFRNGTIYIGAPTDYLGEIPFDEVFPFFHWLVAEVDFARYKATGLTYTVDNGGVVTFNGSTLQGGLPSWSAPSFDVLTPQLQTTTNPITFNGRSVTETGPILTKAFQAYLGTFNAFAWGKAPYAPGENGGISGVVTYSITRAEHDPAYAAVEEWEPGIPRVQVNLYADANYDKLPDDMVDGVAGFTAPDVDRYPLGNFPGVEDIDRNSDGIFDYGDAVQVTWSDSWDDSNPTGCIPSDFDGATPEGNFTAHPGTPIAKTLDCYDGLRAYNQVRDGVFDGGYAFASSIVRDGTGAVQFDVSGNPVETASLAAGFYIVETDIPVGMEIVKEEDKNVDFGVAWVPTTNKLPAECVGALHTVPQYLSFQTDASGIPLPEIDPADLLAAPFAGTDRPLCDRKSLALTDGSNAATDFNLFSQVPISSNLVGVTLNDLANQFDPNNPNFGEKAAPSWVPISVRDWTGNEIGRIYTDEFGKYNGRLPGSYSVNVNFATGLSPSMLQLCLNDPGGNDPFFNPQYNSQCYTLQFLSGSTTYADTPILPNAAFATQSDFPVDCELPTATPMIASVDSLAGGPFVSDAAGADRTLTITSRGAAVDVLNPAYSATNGLPKTIARDYSFGTARGVVKLGGQLVSVQSWTADQIVVTVPAGTTSGNLMVTTAAGKTTELGVYVSVFDETAAGAPAVVHVAPSLVAGATPLQDAVDAAADGDLLLIQPGEYPELVVVNKRIQLQGYGAYATVINAANTAQQFTASWTAKINAVAADPSYLIPEQITPILTVTVGPGITVLEKTPVDTTKQLRIDGLTVKSASLGGGILVNGHATDLKITNNLLTANSGNYSGGIQVGHPDAIVQGPPILEADADNDNIVISNNKITQNGTTFGEGAGIAMYTGADNYAITDNFICGNFAQDNGAGIVHHGFSNGGTIAGNTIIFNQSFYQLGNPDGGGIALLSRVDSNNGLNGTGAVAISGNLIQGNHAGAGNGGGISIVRAMNSLIDITNNMVVNNVAGGAAGGIAVLDSGNVKINHNTIANNDSTATIGILFDPSLAFSNAQPGAGVAAFAHSNTDVSTALGGTFSSPEMNNNIIWHNRQFHVVIDTIPAVPVVALVPDAATPVFSDTGVIGVAGSLSDVNTINSVNTVDAMFVAGYPNEAVGTDPVLNELAALTTPALAAAFDEGGNFIDLRYGPVTVGASDYHITAASPAKDVASVLLTFDFDGNNRTRTAYAGPAPDIGADEYVPDTDGDGVYDDLDNCINIANGHQYNANAGVDVFGNICDGDLNNDNVVNLLDFNLFLPTFGTTNPEADLNNDGVVNLLDFNLFVGMFATIPGPSGLTP